MPVDGDGNPYFNAGAYRGKCIKCGKRTVAIYKSEGGNQFYMCEECQGEKEG